MFMLRWLAEEVRSALRRIRLGSISYKAVEPKFRSKYGVTAKQYRKMFYRACKEVALREVCDFIESRVESLSVGDLHYDSQLSRADRAHSSIAEKVSWMWGPATRLRELLGIARGVLGLYA
jgi:intergrase/recombinase